MSRQKIADGLEGRALLPLPRAIAILGAPVEAGASVPGAAMGPAMLRTAGIVKTLRDLGHDVEDRGDLASPPPLIHLAVPEGKAHRFAEVAAWARLLARETYAVARSGRTPIVLGGDHSIAMGSISGVARFASETGRDLFVLWLDAHSDFNTPLTSPSGNMHGVVAIQIDVLEGQRRVQLGPQCAVRQKTLADQVVRLSGILEVGITILIPDHFAARRACEVDFDAPLGEVPIRVGDFRQPERCLGTGNDKENSHSFRFR